MYRASMRCYSRHAHPRAHGSRPHGPPSIGRGARIPWAHPSRARGVAVCLVSLFLVLSHATLSAYAQGGDTSFDKLTFRLYAVEGHLEGYLVFERKGEEVSYQGPATLELVCGEKRVFNKRWNISVSSFRSMHLGSGRTSYGVTLPSIDLSKLKGVGCRSAFAKLTVKEKTATAMVRLDR